MKVELLDHLPAEVDSFALEDSHSSFYQTSTWINSLNAAFPNMFPFCLVAKESGESVGYISFMKIKKGPLETLWSMPFGTYGGALTKGRKDVFNFLVKEFFGLANSLRTVEVGMVDFHNMTAMEGARRERCSTQLIDLSTGYNELWERLFEKSKRRQARRGERKGLTIVDASNLEQIGDYYRIYRERMGLRSASFIYPKKLFVELILKGGDRVKLHLVCMNDLILGGHVNFYFKDTVIAWNGVTRDCKEGYQASTFLYARIIKRACEQGYKCFDLGGSIGKSSLRQYKAAIGGRDYEYSLLRKTTLPARFIHALKHLVPRRRI